MVNRNKFRWITIGFLPLALVILLLLTRGRFASFNSRTPTFPSPLLLGTNVWPGYEPLYLARDLSYFEDSAIRLVEYSSASQVIKAFRNDTIQIAALTLDEALILKEQGKNLRVILIFDISHGADVILAQAGITTVRDLRGRTVGVENTALGAYVFTRALQQADMSATDVKLIPIEVDKHERSFLEKKVDAVITFEPIRSRLLETGAKQLFDSSQIPGEILDVLVIHPNALAQQADQVKVLLRGWFKALKYLNDKPESASQKMADRLKLDPEKVLKSFSGLRLPSLDENIAFISRQDGDPSKLMQTSHRLVEVMNQNNLLKGGLQLNNFGSAEILIALKKP